MSNKIIFASAVLAAGMGIAANFFLSSDFKTLNDESHKWRDYRGQWVVVNYFAEWCAPCLKEVPELNEFDAMIQDKRVKLFAVSYDALSTSELQVIKDKYDMKFSVISSEPTPKMLTPLPKQLPATYIISPEGEVLKRLMGEQTSEGLLEIVQKLQTL